jgi:hypothetical protein
MRYILLGMVVFFLAACSEDECPSVECSNSGDSVKILSVKPEQTVGLKVGDTVKIAYEVEYNLESSEIGQIALVVQSASNEIIANEFYVASKGQHKEVLEAEIVVPDTRLIHVFTPLSPQGRSQTTIVESRLHKVVQ